MTIVGLPSNEYWSADQAVTKLKPRESGVIQVEIALPEKGGVLGQRYNLGVLVTSPYDADVTRSADLALDVTPSSGITLTATPLTAYGRSSAEYAVELTNNGNIDLSVALVAADEQDKATITLTPDKLSVQAAQQGQPAVSEKAKLAVRAKSILAGPERGPPSRSRRRWMRRRAARLRSVSSSRLVFHLPCSARWALPSPSL